MSSSSTSPSPSPYLPIELVIEILLRLPVKPLIKFTSVCKGWYSLIRNPNFITTYLNRSISSSYADNGYILVLSANPALCTEKTCSVLCDNTFVEHSKLEFPLDTHETPKIVGSCNGVLCVTDFQWANYGFNVSLWNPSLRIYKTLPHSFFDEQLSFNTYAVLGFGFCHRTNDYKVIRFLYFDDDPDLDDEVEVYSLSTNSWRRIEASVPLIVDGNSVAFVNGALHWMAAKAGSRRPYGLIMSFDVADEIFEEIKPPANCLDGVGADAFVVDFKGLLSLFVRLGSERCYIWVMREYGVTESWTKQFTIVPQEKVERPLGFTKNGQLLLQTIDEDLVSCDLQNLQFQDLEIVAGMYGVDATFMESLVLLEEGNVEFRLENEAAQGLVALSEQNS